MLTLACTNTQKIRIDAAPKTAGGKDAQLEGGLQADVLAGDGTVELIPGTPNSLYLVSGDASAVTNFRLFGDADLGAGVKHLEEFADLTVSGEQATAFGLSINAPESK